MLRLLGTGNNLAASYLLLLLLACFPSAWAADAERGFLGVADAVSVSASGDPAVVESLQYLQTTAQNRGTVRVIVGVRAAFAPEGKLSPAQAQLQKKEIADAQSAVLAATPLQRKGSIKRFKTIPFLAVEVDSDELAQLAHDYDVTSIEEDRLAFPTLADSVPLIGGTEAWNAGYTGQGQTVAVLDTGVDKNHPFLAGKVVSEACYSTTSAPQAVVSVCPGGVAASTAVGSGVNCTGATNCDHGTHVAGIVAGRGSSFSGVAPDARIIAVQVFSKVTTQDACGEKPAPCTTATWGDILQGLERVFALRSSYNIAAVNMSLGGGQYLNQASCDAQNSSVKTIIDNLRSVGIATVISSGNASYTDSMGAPGCISTAVSVGSTNKNDQVSQFSNSAGFLNLLAPGENIRSSILGDGFANFNGTSMAAPHVAGAWALLKQKTPGLSVAAALNALASTGQPVMDYRNGITKPRIDVAGALGVGGAPSLGTPTALPSTNLTASAFTANWTPVNGADGYRLDVSPNSGFTSYVAGYQNLDVGNATSRAVGGLSASAAYYYRVRAYGAAGTSGNSNTVSATTAAAAGPQPLSNGQVVGGLSGTAGSESHFFIDVPSGASTLRVRMSGGTGDADLYLRRNDPPATSAYDCRPYLPPGPDEECLVASPRAGRYYIMLQGYTAYSGVTLTASYVAETSIAVPPAPTANVAGNLSANGFTANWSAAATADGYRLDVARDSGFWTWEPIPAAR